MTIVIKEIVVKTTVESEQKEQQLEHVPEEWLEQVKEEILKEVAGMRLQEMSRRER